jgi:hypothetical protein
VTRRRSRVARDLALAPVSYCPWCRRDTKTVGEGACADCWQAKEIGGRSVFEPPPSPRRRRDGYG